MKLNWAERWAVNNPSRVIQQKWEIGWLKRKAGFPPGGAFLEVGCGRGAGARLIYREFKPKVFHASDLDIQMIRKGEEYLSVEDRKLIRFLVADALTLPYRNETLDAVFAFGVLHHVPEWQNALTEISRVLKMGGTYFFEELYPALYQNFLTKHILLHPRENRFRSQHLKQVLSEEQLELRDYLEVKMLGILGIAVKSPSVIS
jgi:ubiquinone/menaquinone biosynthesis C-methylase UbiE